MIRFMARIEDRAEILIAQLEVEVPGLKHEVRDSKDDTTIIRPSNLEELGGKVMSILEKKPWYKPLLEDLHQGKKSAIFTVAFGGLTIFVATAAGFEFGFRHGRDLRHLSEIIGRKKEEPPI